MKKRILFILLALVLAFSVGLVACNGQQEEEEEEEEEEPQEVTVLIGGSFPLTGPYPEDGAAVLAAFQHYAEWVNDNHKMAPWSTDSFPENVTLEVVQMDDGASPPTAQTNYATLKGQGLKMFRMSGSGIATAMMDGLLADEVAATTMASGPYLVTPRTGTIFSNYPIYTDQCAGIADWFMDNWEGAEAPRVAYLTNTSFGQTLLTPEMDAYLESIGYEVVKGCPAVPTVPTGPAETAPMLSWCQSNNIDLTLGAMLVIGAVHTMTEAETLGIGWNLAYEMTIGLCSPAHLTIFLRDAPAGTGNGLVVAGSYPPWSDTGDGVEFCKTLMDTYGEGFEDTLHIMYQHGVVEAMIQVEAIRLALINTGKSADDLTSADILDDGFFQISGLDTGGIIPTDISYGPGDVEGAEEVRLDRNEGGVDVLLGSWPLRHVY
jgi:ABC-type branched-subunit amino acid transport system substrate-binding protein